MKKPLIFLLTSFISLVSFCQQWPLIAQQENGSIYLSHEVSPKENWYSVGRLYGISPKDLAPFNNSTLNTGLEIGQTLKIPLNNSNFVQNGRPGPNEVLVPVCHKVQQKEGLFRISQQYNKVPIDRLKSWNNLNSDEIAVGMNLIVGYLKVDKTQSAYAKAATNPVNIGVSVKNEQPVSQVPPPVEKPGDVRKGEEVSVKTDTSPTQRAGTSVDNTGGVFKNVFNEQNKSGSGHNQLSGQAASFKSTSGWKDGKYYALMNKIPVGTILKITNKDNGRSIYAKVLGELPPGKENEGLILRVSNAGASDLQANDTQFAVDLEWSR